MFHRGHPVRYTTVRDAEATHYLREDGPLAVIDWDPQQHRLVPLVRHQNTPDASYVQIDSNTPIWQLETGWYAREGHYRWTEPLATARLRRPPGAKQFEIVVNIGTKYLSEIGRSRIAVLLDGERIGEAEFTETGWRTARWNLAPGSAGPVQISIQTSPELRTTRVLGSAIVAFGFLEKN